MQIDLKGLVNKDGFVITEKLTQWNNVQCICNWIYGQESSIYDVFEDIITKLQERLEARAEPDLDPEPEPEPEPEPNPNPKPDLYVKTSIALFLG